MRLWIAFALLAALPAVACGDDDDSTGGSTLLCTPGKAEDCTCPGGTKSSQPCLEDGSGYAPCLCETGHPDAGSGGGGGSAGGTGGSGATAGAGGSSAGSSGIDPTNGCYRIADLDSNCIKKSTNPDNIKAYENCNFLPSGCEQLPAPSYLICCP